MFKVATVSGSTFTAVNLKGSSTGGSATRQSATEIMRIGDTGEYLPVWKVDDTRAATAGKIWNDYDKDTGLYRIFTGQLSANTLPPLERIMQWGYWTPAFDIDPGVPDAENGITGDDGQRGSRKTGWKSRHESGTKNGINARSYTNALVLWAPGAQAQKRDYDTYSEDIDLDGTFYALRADGSTGPAITSIRLRSGEGAILMRQPVP
jgi:hypothetical protein